MPDTPGPTPAAAPAAAPVAVRRIGCVSYLNARPLIEGLDALPGLAVRPDVPSRLLDDLRGGAVEVALCPVIDYYRSAVPLEVVPVGAIGCRGPTLTVRLFSRVPPEQITAVHADTDSHTSVALLRVLLRERFHITPPLIDYHAREHAAQPPQAMLLIGDKVVTACPPADLYPHQLDLGEAWHNLTGLPFVFAIWMTRAGSDLGDLPARLEQQRRVNAGRIEQIVDRHAAAHGWPRDLALRYLGELIRYAVGPHELAAIERFAGMAHNLGLIARVKPLVLRR